MMAKIIVETEEKLSDLYCKCIDIKFFKVKRVENMEK